MLVGTDVCVRMIFVPGGNPPVCFGDHMTINKHTYCGHFNQFGQHDYFACFLLPDHSPKVIYHIFCRT